MVDESALGAVGAPFELDVERGKIFELARAIHSDHPAYLGGDHPMSPPTFLTTILFWGSLVEGSDPWVKVRMDQRRGMHAEQEFVYFGPPPRAGTRLRCQSRIERIYTKTGRRGGSMSFAVMVTEFRDAAGRLVAEARMTGVETDRGADRPAPSGPQSGGPSGPAPAPASPIGPRRSAGSGVRFAELLPGTEPPPFRVGPLTRTDFVRYQGASGDMVPIHHDETYARAAGYSAPLGIGMFHAGVLSTWATDWLGPEHVRRFRCRWQEAVWPGDVLVCSGRLNGTRLEDGVQHADVELTCAREGAGVAVQAWMSFVVPE